MTKFNTFKFSNEILHRVNLLAKNLSRSSTSREDLIDEAGTNMADGFNCLPPNLTTKYQKQHHLIQPSCRDSEQTTPMLLHKMHQSWLATL